MLPVYPGATWRQSQRSPPPLGLRTTQEQLWSPPLLQRRSRAQRSCSSCPRPHSKEVAKPTVPLIWRSRPRGQRIAQSQPVSRFRPDSASSLNIRAKNNFVSLPKKNWGAGRGGPLAHSFPSLGSPTRHGGAGSIFASKKKHRPENNVVFLVILCTGVSPRPGRGGRRPGGREGEGRGRSTGIASFLTCWLEPPLLP